MLRGIGPRTCVLAAAAATTWVLFVPASGAGAAPVPPAPVVPTTGAVTPPEPTTTPQRPPITTETPTPPVEPPGEPPEGPRTCASFATRDEAQRYYDLIRLKSPSQAQLLDRDGDGRACRSAVDRGEETEPRPEPEEPDVVPTEDDGSAARVSGSQVREVPEGSIDTGAPR